MDKNITRREWMEHIRGVVANTAALILVLMDGWLEMTNEDREEAMHEIKGKVDTILTMIKARHVF